MNLTDINSRNKIGIFLQENEFCGSGVEVGVYQGDFLSIILETWHSGFMYGVDPWEHQVEGYRDIANSRTNEHLLRYEISKKLEEKYKDRCKLKKMYSIEAAKDFEDESLDFVYIDANHSEKECFNDLKAWYPKIKKGGLFSGHDFVDNPKHPNGNFGVISACKRFFNDRFQEIVVIPDDIHHMWPTWCIIK